ncbi:MAG TPA: hypothetical protein VMB03_28405 [Bryobacteraceae bacterium]|nr:hypothetical protein [Bryobacteraceae bacterium]
MYEKPNLNTVGKAEDVILGIALMGADLDYNWMVGQDEFADDGEALQQL